MTNVTAHPYVTALTPLRGIAAMAIVLFHGIVAFGATSPFVLRADLLKTAVTFFFILSGFVLTLSWRENPALSFWWRRASRLLPLYLVAWLAALAGRSWLHWDSSQIELATSLLLIQAWVPNEQMAMAVNPPAWSLSCEAMFYLLLPAVAPRVLAFDHRMRRMAILAIAAWLALSVGLSQLLPLEWWAGYRASEFAAGILLAAQIRAGWKPGKSLRLLAKASISLIFVLAISGLNAPGPVANLCALPAFIFAIAYCATSPVRSAWLDNILTQAVGRWSYALYITHWIIVVLMSRFLSSPAWIPVVTATCIIVAGMLHSLLERPAESALLRLSHRQRDLLINRPRTSCESQ